MQSKDKKLFIVSLKKCMNKPFKNDNKLIVVIIILNTNVLISYIKASKTSNMLLEISLILSHSFNQNLDIYKKCISQ